MATKIRTVDDIPAISEWARRNGLELNGRNRYAKTVMVNGYPKEKFTVTIKLGVDSKIQVPDNSPLFEDGEKQQLEDICKNYELYQPIPYTAATIGSDAPPAIRKTILDLGYWADMDWGADALCVPIRDKTGQNIAMIEQRCRGEDGVKQYYRWSYMENGEWAHADLDAFPFWGMEQLDAGHTTVYIHEGAKAAAAGRMFHEVDQLPFSKRDAIKDHPWYPQFSRYPHLGTLGGAHRLGRMDWGYLKKIGIQTVILVPDNDEDGREGAYDVAESLGGIEVLRMPNYPEGTTVGFDVADDFGSLPSVGWQEMPKNLIDITAYWKLVPDPTRTDPDRMKPVWRKEYPKNHAYIKEIERFIINGEPENLIEWSKMGQYYAQHLHSSLTERYGRHAGTRNGCQYDRMTFKPNRPRLTHEAGKQEFNTWHPPIVDPKPMDGRGMRIWNWYLKRIAPNPIERALLKRWIATLLVHPERKHFGVIIHTNTQGTGKTTLYEAILREIIGPKMCVKASNDEFSGRFTDWRESKVLIYGDEISGNSKVSTGEIYQMLKDWVFSDTARIEGKNAKLYFMPDYSKILINSNKEVPLYLESPDRRFLVIRGNERKMHHNQGKALRRWLRGGGLSMILGWAKNIAEDRGADIPKKYLAEDPEFRRTLDLGLPADYLPNNVDAPLTPSKGDLLSKAKPLWFNSAEKLLVSLQGFDEGGLTPEELEDGDTMLDALPMALPMPVLVDAIQNYCAQLNLKVAEATIEAKMKELGLYVSNGKKFPKGGEAMMYQGRISGEPQLRHNIVLNYEALRWAVDRGWIEERHIDQNTHTFVPIADRNGKRSLGGMIKQMKKNDRNNKRGANRSIWRPYWVWCDAKTNASGFKDMRNN